MMTRQFIVKQTPKEYDGLYFEFWYGITTKDSYGIMCHDENKHFIPIRMVNDEVEHFDAGDGNTYCMATLEEARAFLQEYVMGDKE